MTKNILVMDSDPDVLNTLKDLLKDDELMVFPEKDLQGALNCVQTRHPGVALIDITLPKQSGIAVLRAIKEIDPHLCVIMTSGSLNTQNTIEAMKYGAYDYLTKPLEKEQLKSIIQKAFQTNMLTREIKFIDGTAPGPTDDFGVDVMIGSSAEMVEIWKMIGKISATDATVLIQGESGTGKELLARSIFNNSPRKNKPFLAINCAALPENLLESELFGHEKGAFTDAAARHTGKFEQCAGGTIFLDEISEISLKNQAKLLRVLENQEFERVGGSDKIKADVRIIAASNRSLIHAVKDKSFRMDLFYRLKVVTIHLPPLRERPEDIPILAGFFANKFARENHKPVMNISPAAMKLMLSHPWTGNIRELKNDINSAIVFSRGNTLNPEDLEPLLDGNIPEAENSSSLRTHDFHKLLQPLFEDLSRDNEGAVFERFIAEAEKALFRLAMNKMKNNEVHAAKFLGISRNTLRQRLKLHKLR